MYLQLKNYHMANEVLYVLDAVDNCSKEIVSKLALQKLLYLSSSLAPLKDIILSYLRFLYKQRGPYSKDIQNTVDHLVALGLVEVVSFEKTYEGKYALTDYKISEPGKEAVKLLRAYNLEDEKYWWINTVTRLAISYTKAEGFESEDLDNIVKLVYQEPSFKKLRVERKFDYLINFQDIETHITNRLIDFLKKYSERNILRYKKENEREAIEILLLSFFEYLYVNFLSESKHES